MPAVPGAPAAAMPGFHEMIGVPKSGGTTVMLRNIPNKYTRSMLLEVLNEHFKGSFDFLYLPIDFGNRCNVGYAFINFRDSLHVQKFIELFHNVEAKTCLPGFNSQKVCEVSEARVQTLEANLEHFRKNATGNLKEHADWLPLLFDLNGDQLQFPSAGGMNAEAPAFVPTSTSLPEVPQHAVDSRALEFKMHMQADTVKGFLEVPDADGDGEDKPSKKAEAPRLKVQQTLVKNQVEFYFSVDNLCSDLFLRSKMDEEGWVEIATITQFKKMKQFGGKRQDVVAALADSEKIEVSSDSKKIRVKDSKTRDSFRPVPPEYASKSPSSGGSPGLGLGGAKSQGLGLDESTKNFKFQQGLGAEEPSAKSPGLGLEDVPVVEPDKEESKGGGDCRSQ
eukprot:gnl/MRDRNA2_/MRDRNA2_93886_c0_seq1.p1 gnl/MRDRNA2_/MRDRNA2_93886_c0~~gnl/MRDRNA2_/MRDRNA2_93886_c0_seq1.p1  ORF type:complete len:419 (-),score=86.01 gnl/MRDRNA2_/MRDRNA2_93886_c0_seq1:94-1269(-)